MMTAVVVQVALTVNTFESIRSVPKLQLGTKLSDLVTVIRQGKQAAQVGSGHPDNNILSTNLLWDFSQVSSLF